MKRIGPIEPPAIKRVDAEGRNWPALRRKEPLASKQIPLPQLAAGLMERPTDRPQGLAAAG